jgi:hypothetical protein
LDGVDVSTGNRFRVQSMTKTKRTSSKKSIAAAAAVAVAPSTGIVPIADAVQRVETAGLGFERVVHLVGTTYKDNSTVIVIPSRGTIPEQVVKSWLSLIAPMNQKRAILFASGHEVGEAYNDMIKNILANPELSKWKYVMTLEDDNIPPSDAHIRLLESIEWGKYDAVSGLYFTKGEHNMPMAYGDPGEFARTGVLDFRPRDVREALAAGQIMPVNGIAMGCGLWRMDLFREIPPPWYVTVADIVEGKGVQCFTQDLHFCERAVRAAKRFAVDMRVKVGHLDVASGVVF